MHTVYTTNKPIPITSFILMPFTCLIIFLSHHKQISSPTLHFNIVEYNIIVHALVCVCIYKGAKQYNYEKTHKRKCKYKHKYKHTYKNNFNRGNYTFYHPKLCTKLHFAP